MSKHDEIEKWIFEAFETKLNLAVISRDTDLFETGTLDSLSFVDLLAHIEKDFEIKVPLEELEIENFQTIGKMAKFISGKVGGGPAKAGPGRPREAGLG